MSHDNSAPGYSLHCSNHSCLQAVIPSPAVFIILSEETAALVQISAVECWAGTVDDGPALINNVGQLASITYTCQGNGQEKQTVRFLSTIRCKALDSFPLLIRCPYIMFNFLNVSYHMVVSHPTLGQC